jgi:putative transposase
MEGMAEWQSRPLDPVYAVVFTDAIHVKIREGQVANRPVYLALGVTVDGERDVLGLWAGEHGDGEGCGCGSWPRSGTAACGTCAWWSATG